VSPAVDPPPNLRKRSRATPIVTAAPPRRAAAFLTVSSEDLTATKLHNTPTADPPMVYAKGLACSGRTLSSCGTARKWIPKAAAPIATGVTTGAKYFTPGMPERLLSIMSRGAMPEGFSRARAP
jgi:hypothetical protein